MAKLTQAQRRLLYALATLTGGSLIIVGMHVPALAVLVGVLVGVLISEMRKF